MVQAIHTTVPGRARFRVEGLYRSEALKRLLEFRLARNREISHVSASALTGNILVCFNSGSTPQAIESLIANIVQEHNHRLENGTLSAAPGAPSGPPTPLNTVKGYFFGPEDQPQKPWHLLEADEVLARYQTSRESGLAKTTLQENLRKFGANVLPESQPRSAWEIFYQQFNSLPVALLGAAAGLSVVTGGLVDALLIMGVVVANAVIGYKTESEAEKTIRSLQTLVHPLATVIREGKLREVSSEEVTLGDLVVLRPGSYVPADARLVEARHLSVDESALTGESMPVVKTDKTLHEENIPLGDRVNMVFMGTLITGGEGLAVVVAIGSFTEIGIIQSLAGEATTPETPLERQLGEVGDRLVLVCAGICGAVFFLGLWRGLSWLEMLRNSICLAAAAVPEGLPAAATTTLVLGVRDMRRHHVLIRRLNAVETLGAVEVVCLDKTGTITHNQMSVVQIFSGMKVIKVAAGKFWSTEGAVSLADHQGLARLLEVSILCNETKVYCQEGQYSLRGTPTECALVDLAIKSGLDVKAVRRRYPLERINYRSEDRPFMGSFHQHTSKGKFLAIKGSPLEVLAMCDQYLRNGRKTALKEEDRLEIEAENSHMAGEAQRVLGLAYAEGKDFPNGELPAGLVWLGMIGMADPVREGVKEALAAFHRAGIKTMMITGDQSPTAYAIGKELNLSQGTPLEILDSTHLADIDPEALQALANQVQVFSRVSPAHKLQIVQVLQKSGKVIAMTGDGINDGPALKAADVGIAMGHTGTDIAREVADVVLEKDNLDTLIIAIRDGRTIYLNIRKSVHFFLATNFSELILTFGALAVGLGSPLTAMQLLWINLISDIFPGLALAMEAPEPEILEQPPRDPQQPIFSADDYQRMGFEAAVLSAGAMGAYGYGIVRYGMGAAASTMAFHSLTAGQLLHAYSCRSEKHSIFSQGKLPPNKYLNLAVGGSLLLQLGVMFIPGIRSILGLTPVGLLDGLVIGGTTLLPLLVNEATKTGAPAPPSSAPAADLAEDTASWRPSWPL
ncbi:MAG: HAD-IC family P-type ATPase [Thermodesulfobacteriota bacterium]